MNVVSDESLTVRLMLRWLDQSERKEQKWDSLGANISNKPEEKTYLLAAAGTHSIFILCVNLVNECILAAQGSVNPIVGINFSKTIFAAKASPDPLLKPTEGKLG